MGMRLVKIVFGNNFGVTSILAVLLSTLPSLLDASCLLETYANESPKQMYRDELRWKSNDVSGSLTDPFLQLSFLSPRGLPDCFKRHRDVINSLVEHGGVHGPDSWALQSSNESLCGMSLYLRNVDNLSQWTAHSIDFIVSRSGILSSSLLSSVMSFQVAEPGRPFDILGREETAMEFKRCVRLRVGVPSKEINLYDISSWTGLLPAVAAAHGRYMVASIRMVLDRWTCPEIFAAIRYCHSTIRFLFNRDQALRANRKQPTRAARFGRLYEKPFGNRKECENGNVRKYYHVLDSQDSDSIKVSRGEITCVKQASGKNPDGNQCILIARLQLIAKRITLLTRECFLRETSPGLGKSCCIRVNFELEGCNMELHSSKQSTGGGVNARESRRADSRTGEN
ncbi:hypothetical protein FB446DRAFT_819986 [Lentinula raphanica]|nr:hypothetical protein FB446DRAFT_819986 [Lentinula raphanica]